MGDNGEGGRSAGGSPAGAGPHPVSADQSSPVRDIITTKWGAASSQITLYKHLYPDPAFLANVTCKILYSILTSCVRTQQWVECDCQFPRLYWFRVLSGSGLLVSRHISQLSGTKFPVGVWEFESILQLQEERREVIRRRNWWKLFATYLTNWRAAQHLAYASSWTLLASWIRGIRIWHLGSYRRHEAIIGKS